MTQKPPFPIGHVNAAVQGPLGILTVEYAERPNLLKTDRQTIQFAVTGEQARKIAGLLTRLANTLEPPSELKN